MYKRLRIYNLYTALPFILLLLAAFVYRDSITKTIESNPHPQINYLIFIITLVGGTLILMSMKKLMHETKELNLFTDVQRQGATTQELHEMALECDADVAYVLRMIAATSHRTITHQEQIALENELHKASTRLSSRNALPQFLSGLLVGLGLLGTFIGLLATLDDIAVLIASFGSFDMATADPVEIFGEMVKRMEAPMHSMGVAFSASMYGLLGSLVLSFMMVSLKRCLNEILAILGSEIAQHIEFALAHDGFAYTRTGLSQDYSKTSATSLTLDSDITEPTKTLTAIPDQNDNAAQENQPKTSESTLLNAEVYSEELKILSRIEERMAESAKLQERALTSEIRDFQSQRGDMLRTLAESTEAANSFRSELQRVGRQLGSMLSLIEQNSVSVTEQLVDVKLRMATDAHEIQRLTMQLIEATKERS